MTQLENQHHELNELINSALPHLTSKLASDLQAAFWDLSSNIDRRKNNAGKEQPKIQCPIARAMLQAV